jgi:hypothetical protein
MIAKALDFRKGLFIDTFIVYVFFNVLIPNQNWHFLEDLACQKLFECRIFY